jgi:uncharacterized repeat protein (TIGR03803 family)
MRRNKISEITFFIAFCTAMFFITITSASAAAQEKVLHSFTGADGGGITSGLVSDAAGNLYGMALSGGANGVGSVFELSPQTSGSWTLSVLYSFLNNCVDAANPSGTLVFDTAGNLYGTTVGGGPYSDTCKTPPGQEGYGTVFELSPPASGAGSWTETILHNFTGVTNNSFEGTNPEAGVIFDATGNIYGTTAGGGEAGHGTVFVLIKERGWEQHVLHNFSIADGVGLSGLIMDSAGNLYGTATYGGYGEGHGAAGTVWKITPGPDWSPTMTVLYSFETVGGKGTNPQGNLVMDADGNLYGTTQGTGVSPLSNESEVFELSNNGSQLEVLYRFAGNGNGRDIISGLVFDGAGNLYGTSYQGGTNVNCPSNPGNPPSGCGTVFKLTPGANDVWTEQQLHSFSDNGMDGYWPEGSLIFGPNGNLYGTTYLGGDSAMCTNTTYGCGTVFQIAP